MSNKFFPFKNHAVYEIMRKKKHCRAG